MKRTQSEELFVRARTAMPGGVNSPVRAFKSVGGTPVFFESGTGARLTDIDGNQYIDFVGSWGPLIQGYNFQPVVDAIIEQAQLATSFGAPCLPELELVEEVVARIPSIEQVRMVNSGTEATLSAIRLARGFTGREVIVKFAGCFHGHGDSLLAKAGSGVLTLGLPDSPGVPESLAQHTLTVPYNNIEAVNEVFTSMGEQVACVIVEPIAGNMGCILPEPGFLEQLRKLTKQHGSLLIFDEVMTGFRVAHGGVQELYGIAPDITTLGKIIGAGLPVGAYGGSVEIMSSLAPDGPIYQSGTLSGNPLAMAAGLALLNTLDAEFYRSLYEKTENFVTAIRALATKHEVNLTTNHTCGMFSLFFTEQTTVNNFDTVTQCSTELYRHFFQHMLDRGVYFAPSAFESGFINGCHTAEDLEFTLQAIDEVFRTLK